VVTRIKPGDVLERGERIGIIRFGSRVDVFLPMSFKPVVSHGDHVFAGKTIIAIPENL
jgi:phosphatidylserine decarboxylase